MSGRKEINHGLLENEPATVMVAIPVYNHLQTIRDVAERALTHLPNVVIIDDGSREDVAAFVKGLQVTVLRHTENQGKGRAILTAAEYAARHHMSHLITLDADGQHYPEQIPDFLNEIRKRPGSIILGVRNFGDSNAPFSSRFGRAFGNFWVRIQTGVKIRDIQSGYRAYPVYVLQHLKFLFRTYAFEDEVIVRALWAGVPVKEIPVSVYYPERSRHISHFCKLRDNLKLTILNTYLTIRSFLPWPHIQLQFENGEFIRIHHPLKIIRELLGSRQPPARLAMAATLGVLLGTLPLIACHTLAIIYAASMVRLNKIMAIAASQICMPPLVPALCISLGYYLRFGTFLTFKNVSSLTGASFRELGYMGLERLAEWFIGSLILGPLLALVAGVVVFLVALTAQKSLSVSNGSAG